MTRSLYPLALGWALGWALVAHSAERGHFFENIGSEQGLAQNTVNAIFQDRSGFIWIGTQGGLHKYDGYKFVLYQHNADDPASMPESFITAISEDANGRLWVGSNVSNVARLDPATGTFQGFQQPRSVGAAGRRNSIGALFFDPKRGLWIGSAAGIELLDPNNGARRDVHQFGLVDGLGPQVRGFSLGTQGDFWAATSLGLWRIDGEPPVAQRVAAETLPSVLAVYAARDGHVYAGANDGLYRIELERKSATRIWPSSGAPRSNELINVWDIAEDHRGALWLAIRGEGLVNFDPASGSSQWLRHDRQMPGSLPEQFVTTLMVDRSGLLWVGGEAKGVAKSDPRGSAFTYVVDQTAERSVAANNIRAIWEDDKQRIWLGTEGDGLKRYDRKSGKFESFGAVLGKALGYSEQPAELRVFVVTDADSGKLWVSSNQGVFLLDPEARTASALPVDPQRRNALPDAVVRSLLKARDGSLWMGTFSAGLVHYWPQQERWEFLRHQPDNPDSLSHNMILALKEDRAGRLWIGTLDGLNVLDPGLGRVRRIRQIPGDATSLSGNLVRAIHESASGQIWIGTHSGLNRLDELSARDARFTRFLAQSGLPNATIYGIIEDGRGRLWLSTNRGISSFDPDARVFRDYGLKDGLQGLEFNGGAFHRTAAGELLFGGLNGLNIFRAETLEASAFVPPVVITALQIGANRSEVAQPELLTRLEVEQSARIYSFEFAALDFAAPERNRFAYRLDGFDDVWVDVGGKHDATYTNLDPGDYTFRVRASNRDGVWNEDGLALALSVRAPFWLSTPMRALYALGGVVAAWLLWRNHRRKRSEELRHHHELREREDRLKLALWGSGDEFWDWDIKKHHLYRIGADQLLGFQEEQLISDEDWRTRAIHPDDLPLVEKRLADHIEGRTTFFESEHRIINAKGEWVWVLSRGKVVERADDGQPLRIAGTARDISESRRSERERRIAAEVIRSMTEAVTVTDLDFRFVSVNAAFTRMTGYTEAEVLNHTAALLNCAQHPPEHYHAMREQLMRTGHWHGELWQRRKDGEEFLSWLELSEVRDASGLRTQFVGVISDITDRKRAEQELRYLANYDTLTGLPNRTLLGERLAHAIIRARRTGHRVAVLFLDLDRFKHVNDSMGHAAGDRMLKAAGTRLRATVREADTVARLGGDEFTVVLEDVRSAAEAEDVALKLLEVFGQPLEVEGRQEVVISPSIGISLYPDHAQVPTDLLKFADTAMYQAKDRGRNTYQMYTEAMDTAARQRATMIGCLRKALERGEFRIVLQPKIAIVDNRVTGAEVLLRWHSEELGEVSPGVFIPLAEESGLIVAIGDWVLNQACLELVRWRKAGLGELVLAVNLSVLQLLRGDITQRLCDILAEHDVAPNRIELELTESVVMANAQQCINTLTALRSVGVTLAIDDFGTGYSSLAYLKRLPIDTLKIDKEFVGDITTDPEDEAITATIITMAHSLGLNVIAEGVESREQLDYLREQKCDEIQGNWLSPPMPPERCLEFIRERMPKRRLAAL